MAAPQGWSRWYDDAPTHPKFLAVGHKGGWLYVCGQAYASTHATDGMIPKAIVPRLTDVPNPMKVAAQLVEVGLWHDRGDHFEQHDYMEMQTTAEEREQKRRDKSKGGSKGNHVRHHANKGVVNPECPWCESQNGHTSGRTTVAAATPNQSQRGSPEAETEAEGVPPSAGGEPPRHLEPVRDGDVNAGVLMAEHLEQLEARPPSDVIGITSRKVKQLLEADRIPPDDVRAALALLREKGRHPSILGSLVEEARAERRAKPRRPADVDARSQPPVVGSPEWEARERAERELAERLAGEA